MDFKIFSWNVRGLGNRDKGVVVAKCISLSQADIICLQEAKIGEWNDILIREIWG